MNRTYSPTGSLATAVLLVASLAVVALPAQLAAEAPPVRADVTVFAGGVDFRPAFGHAGATITVSGNGIDFQLAFESGERPSIGMFDDQGQPLTDGTYSWTLSLRPDKATAKQLRIAASQNGGRTPEPWTAQSGTFTIRDGLIVDPDLVEARPARAEGSGLTASGFGISSGFSRAVAAEDSDDFVADRPDAEQRARLEATGPTTLSAVGGVLPQANPAAGEDADATAVAYGRSLEAAAAPSDHQLSAQPVPRPRSDGSNGRPRSQ